MRTNPDLSFEHNLWKSGLKYVAGLDEAGRGALAGPVAVGAVILRSDGRLVTGGGKRRKLRPPADALSLSSFEKAGLEGVRDSKQMTPTEREEAAPRIKDLALCWGVGFASAEEIDSDGIVAATRLAAMRAVDQLAVFPEYLLTDFRLELPELDVPQTSLVKGDARCLSIAAASVLAKTARDALMREMDEQIPGYGLGRHKGYGTAAHILAIQRMGHSTIHRRTFIIREAMETQSEGD